MSANVAYAMDLMQRGHPRTSAARAAGCHVSDVPLMPLARADYSPPPPPLPPLELPGDRIRAIMARVGKPFGITPQMMKDIRQTRRVAWPRMAAMATLREEMPHLSYPALGRIFGGRHHTTVMNGVREHQARMAWADFLIWAGKP